LDSFTKLTLHNLDPVKFYPGTSQIMPFHDSGSIKRIYKMIGNWFIMGAMIRLRRKVADALTHPGHKNYCKQL
jgi:hypothetical protein